MTQISYKSFCTYSPLLTACAHTHTREEKHCLLMLVSDEGTQVFFGALDCLTFSPAEAVGIRSTGKFLLPECLSEAVRWRRTTATAGSVRRINDKHLLLITPLQLLLICSNFFSAASTFCPSHIASCCTCSLWPSCWHSLSRTSSGPPPHCVICSSCLGCNQVF